MDYSLYYHKEESNNKGRYSNKKKIDLHPEFSMFSIQGVTGAVKKKIQAN